MYKESDAKGVPGLINLTGIKNEELSCVSGPSRCLIHIVLIHIGYFNPGDNTMKL